MFMSGNTIDPSTQRVGITGRKILPGPARRAAEDSVCLMYRAPFWLRLSRKRLRAAFSGAAAGAIFASLIWTYRDEVAWVYLMIRDLCL